MTESLGRISLLLAVATWAVFLVLPLWGGLDPSPSAAVYLRGAAAGTLALAVLSFGLAITALALGPQRVSAGVAVVLCVAFGMVFSGALYALLG